jgi:hypothetical protein
MDWRLKTVLIAFVALLIAGLWPGAAAGSDLPASVGLTMSLVTPLLFWGVAVLTAMRRQPPRAKLLGSAIYWAAYVGGSLVSMLALAGA